MSRRRSVGVPGLVLGWAMAQGLIVGPGVANGQDLANPLISDFEAAPAGSYEWDLLGRLWVTGVYEPADLARLSRLTVLESIAMYQNLRADLRATMIGARLEGEMSALWEAAELFYVGASSGPMDLDALTRSRVQLADLGVAYRQVDVTLGTLPGLSPRGAFHLRDIARLLPTMSDVLDAMEAETLETAVTPPMPRPLDLGAIREHARLLAEELRGLIRSVMDSRPAPAGRDALIADLNDVLDLVRGFDRLLTAEPSPRDLVGSLRVVRSRIRPVEARIIRLAGAPEPARRWRQVRQRLNALADDLGLSRVISLAVAARPAQGVDRTLLAQVDRAVAALDAFLSESGPGLAETVEGSLFRDDAAQLRRDLLQFRQQVAANEPPEQLSRSLRRLKAGSRRLSDRALADRRIINRGVSRLDIRGFQEPARAIAELRDPLPKS